MMKNDLREGDNGALAPSTPTQPGTLLADRLRNAFMVAQKCAAKAPVSLPAPKWVAPDGGKVSVLPRDRAEVQRVFAAPERPVGGAVADLEETDMVVSYHTKGDELMARRAKVWRIKPPRALADLTAEHRMALEDYADAVHRVGASGGTSDPTSSGGGVAGSRCASVARLAAVESLRAMVHALDGCELSLQLFGARGRRRGGVRVSYAQLVHWVAVDHLEATEVLRRSGFLSSASAAAFPKSTDAFAKRVRLAVVDAAERLLRCDVGLFSVRRRAVLRTASKATL